LFYTHSQPGDPNEFPFLSPTRCSTTTNTELHSTNSRRVEWILCS